MADTKISALPAATLPLAGTEQVPLVQGADTDRVAASELGKVNGAVDLTGTDPAAPPANTVRLFRREVAGRQMPAFVGPSGLGMALQPFLARNKIGRWTPVGNSTVLGTDGLAAPLTDGFATSRLVDSANLFTRTRRIGYRTSTTPGSRASARVGSNQFRLGTGATQMGGFLHISRFGFSALAADTRAFFGMMVEANPPNIEPSTMTNCIGIGRGGSDTTMRLFYGGSAAQPPIDLGVNFPANTSNVDMYELALFAPPSQEGVVNYMVTRLNTGHVAEGQLTGGAVQLPSDFIQGGLFWIDDNDSFTEVAFDLVSLYIETDV